MAASARAGGEINEYRFDREHGLLVRPFRHPSFVISWTIISFLRSSPLLCDMQLLPLEPEAALMGYEVYT